jgi:hypothetical protein
LPSSWRSNLSGRFAANADDGSDQGFDDEDGEELFEVDDNRREALSLDARRGHDGEGRLSRDLEEGFRDDSDDETNANQVERPVRWKQIYQSLVYKIYNRRLMPNSAIKHHQAPSKAN